MIDEVDRYQVRKWQADRGAQIVEVLPQPEFAWAHLPGAVNLPLKELSAQRAAVLDQDRPVIVYCNNTECDMSPRAAVRLRRLGFPQVYDYAAGKVDWLSFGLPHEGKAVLAGDLIDRAVPTCVLDEPLERVRPRLAPDADLVIVVDEELVVQGVLRHDELYHQPGEFTAERLMTFGVTTVRPSEDAQELIERMRRRRVEAVVVTDSLGRHLGLFIRDDALAKLRARRPASRIPQPVGSR